MMAVIEPSQRFPPPNYHAFYVEIISFGIKLDLSWRIVYGPRRFAIHLVDLQVSRHDLGMSLTLNPKL